MSVLLDSFMRYADSIAMPDWEPADVKAGIESYLHDHSLLESDDEISAEVELLIFKEMPPSTFNAFFAKYAKRKAVETIEATARQAALQRALLGEVVSESNYHALCNQLIEAATVLSQDNQNGQWLKGHLLYLEVLRILEEKKKAFLYLGSGDYPYKRLFHSLPFQYYVGDVHRVAP